MRRAIAGLAAAALGLASFTAIAAADSVQTNAGTGRTITAGGSTTVDYSIQATGGNPGDSGSNNCDAARTAVTVTINAPSAVTVSTSSLTFSSCGTSQSVDFSSNTAGTYEITATVGNTEYNTNPAKWTLTVQAASAPADTTAPSISYTLDPATADGSNGWYKGNVSLTWTVTENESAASLQKTGCVDQSITADQAATTYSCSASSAGGSAGPVEVTIKRDGTAPSVSLTGGPADGAVYYLDGVPSAPTCSADDGLIGSGVASCTVNGFATTVGTHTVSASATDNAGNSGTSSSVTYEIKPWTATGLYSPVRMGSDVVNAIKGGSTVPLKFELFRGTTEIDSTNGIGFAVKSYSCDSGDDIASITTETAGSTSLRYDTSLGQFIQNWKAPTTKGCYRATVTLPHGAGPLVAQFMVR